MGNSKMNARERIDYLFDDHSFVEVGGYVSARNTDYNLGANKVEGDGVITGYGVINDRMVYVYSQDVSALGRIKRNRRRNACQKDYRSV